ncbi:MAG: response regulator [Rhodospirillales bacterium]
MPELTPDQLRVLRVLIAEDEVFLQTVMGGALRDIGVRDIATATNGQEALKQVEQAKQPFDIIFLDLQMPIMDGFDFLETLRARKDRETANIPVIVLSGHSELAQVLRAAKTGISGYLVKPVSRAKLLSGVTTGLSGKTVDYEELRAKSGG